MKADKKNFMALDESDFKILFMLTRRSVEFSKLDYPDQKVLAWFVVHSPNKVKSWIDYLVANYEKALKPFRVVNLYNEIKDLLE